MQRHFSLAFGTLLHSICKISIGKDTGRTCHKVELSCTLQSNQCIPAVFVRYFWIIDESNFWPFTLTSLTREEFVVHALPLLLTCAFDTFHIFSRLYLTTDLPIYSDKNLSRKRLQNTYQIPLPNGSSCRLIYASCPPVSCIHGQQHEVSRPAYSKRRSKNITSQKMPFH